MKKNISAKTTIVLSALVLIVCIVMLCVTFVITTNQEQPKPEVVQSIQENKTVENKNVIQDKKTIILTPPTEIVNEPERKNINSKTNSNSVVETKPVKKLASKEIVKNPKSKSEKSKKVVIVLDDGGHNLTQLDYFLELPFPVTIAVLPGLPHSGEAAKKIVNANMGLMLHQPMQAINLSTDPGPKAIKPEMADQEVYSLLQHNYFEIDDAIGIKSLKGINNHEGSLITADERIMNVVMKSCKENNLFFLDSRTNSKSICKKVANQYGVRFFERNIFLDNSPDAKSIISMFKKGIDVSKQKGFVIMIGHIWSGKNLADILQKEYSEYTNKGYEFILLNELIGE